MTADEPHQVTGPQAMPASSAETMATCTHCGADVQAASCRLCGRSGLQSVVCLGRMPLVNEFRPADGAQGQRHPLHLLNCKPCALPQLASAVPPSDLFPEYAYFSSASEPVVRHATTLFDFVGQNARPKPGGLVLEIGSNDGYLLNVYRRRGHRVLGVDPARNVAAHASAGGVPTLTEFFSASLAATVRKTHGPAAVIHASNVLAHVPDIADVAAGIRHLLDDSGVLVVETPSIVELIRRGLYDTIYHEHLYCYSLTGLRRILADAELETVSVETVPAHGGTLRLVARRAGTPDESVDRYLASERRSGVGDGTLYSGFSRRIADFRQLLEQELTQMSDRGRLAGLGAAAKTSIVLNSIEANLDYVCDSTPYKQGTFVPGTTVPVVSPERLHLEPPAHCILFPWNHADAIIAANAAYLRAGGVFVKAVDFKVTEIRADDDGVIHERIRAELAD